MRYLNSTHLRNGLVSLNALDLTTPVGQAMASLLGRLNGRFCRNRCVLDWPMHGKTEAAGTAGKRGLTRC
jgi:hypothetical protein